MERNERRVVVDVVLSFLRSVNILIPFSALLEEKKKRKEEDQKNQRDQKKTTTKTKNPN